jgi:hypothetical protein
VAGQESIFTVTNEWGGEITLTQEDWARITAKRPGTEGYVEQVT